MNSGKFFRTNAFNAHRSAARTVRADEQSINPIGKHKPMKVQHVIAAFLFVCGMGSLVHAQELKKAEEPQIASQAAPPESMSESTPRVKTKSHRKSHRKEASSTESPAESSPAPAEPPKAATPAPDLKTDAAANPPPASPPVEASVPAVPSVASSIAASVVPVAASPSGAPNAVDLSAKIDKVPLASAAPAVPEAGPATGAFFNVKATDVLMVLMAALLAWIAWQQTRRLRETVAAARETAIAADKSARLAENAMISGQRAFMFLKEFRTFLDLDPATGQYQWSIHPIWENSGNTPTRELVINTSYHLSDKPLPDDFDFPHATKDLMPTIAGPKTLVEATPGSISSDELAAVQAGRKYFYIWGWAEYHDMFEGTQKHITRFCNQLTQVTGDTALPLSETNIVQMMFSFYPENNYAD